MTTDWRHQAACRGEDPELFFPAGTPGPDQPDKNEAAKTICRSCPVVDACLQWALNNRATDGIWGGLTEDERRNLRRRTRPPIQCGTRRGYRKHKRDNTEICGPCNRANNNYAASRYRAKAAEPTAA